MTVCLSLHAASAFGLGNLLWFMGSRTWMTYQMRNTPRVRATFMRIASLRLLTSLQVKEVEHVDAAVVPAPVLAAPSSVPAPTVAAAATAKI